MALLELKQRISRYFYPENAPDAGPSKPAANPANASAEVAVPLRDLSNNTAPKASVSAPTSPALGCQDILAASSSCSPVTVLDSPNDSISIAEPESPTIKRLQPQRQKRRSSFGPKAEPLSKKLWRKKERERLRELDEQIRSYTLQIAEKEALYRQASQQKRIEQCDDLTQQLSELLDQKLLCTREKADLKNQITRKSRNTNSKFRTL